MLGWSRGKTLRLLAAVTLGLNAIYLVFLPPGESGGQALSGPISKTQYKGRWSPTC